MRRFHMTVFFAAVFLFASCEDDGQDPAQQVPAAIASLSASSQAGTVGAAVAQPPRVVVRDQAGSPVSGAAVTFAITQGGGTVTGGTVTTNAEGTAAVGGWTLGPQPGLNRLTATVASLPAVVFEALASAGPPAALEVIAGNAQSGPVGKPLTSPIAVRVKDALGNAVSGAAVQFTVLAGGGTVGAAVASDAGGRAETAWTLGPVAGNQSVRASIPGTSATADFTASAADGAAVSLTILSGNGQTGPAGRTLPQQIRVTARDEFGNAAGAGTRIAFASSQGGAVGAADVLTDASGVAGTTWTLRSTAGVNSATAGLPGVPAVVFNATGTAGLPARMVAVSGDGQTGAPGTVLAPLVLQVLDADGNPVGAGHAVQFSTRDGSVSPASATTDGNGQAATAWTLGLILGAQSVLATLTATPAIVLQFDATVVAGAPATITIASGNNQSGLPSQPLAAPIAVLVTDAASSPVANATVDFAVTAGAGSVTPASATTNAAGIASAAWTLGATGAQAATATLSGVPGQVVTFAATLAVGPPTQISIVSGNAQTGTAGSALPAAVVILVQDAANSPVPGVTVDFSIAGGGGSWAPVSPTTNASGQVSATWTLGILPGPNSGAATVAGMPGLSVNLSATGNSPPFSLLALGTHSCGIANVAYCWGLNSFGAIGDNTTTSRSQPTLVSGGNAFTQLAGGVEHSCGLAGGAAWCWGFNATGQLGDGTTTSRTAPTAVSGGLSFTTIAARGHTCAIAGGGQAWCWGDNGSGQLGDASNTQRTTPTAVSGGHNFDRIAVGMNHTCALTTAGVAWCWGSNSNGQLGNGTTTASNVPVAVSTGLAFTSISTGAAHSCALSTTGAAFCWGRNSNGEIGDGTTTQRLTPTAVSGALVFTALASGNAHNCGLAGSAAWCWGGNGSGQVGDGSTSNRTSPVTVAGALSFSAIATGTFHSCGLTSSTTWCWGWNHAGQLGNGSSGTISSVPVAVIQP